MDLETLLSKNSVLNTQLNNAKNVIEQLQNKIGLLQSDNDVLIKKAIYAEQNELNMKNIMTQNIQESNERNQAHINYIAKLKDELLKYKSKE